MLGKGATRFDAHTWKRGVMKSLRRQTHGKLLHSGSRYNELLSAYGVHREHSEVWWYWHAVPRTAVIASTSPPSHVPQA
jgi:hypothetical protein